MSDLADRIATEARIQQELTTALDFAETIADPAAQFDNQAIASLRYMLQGGDGDGYKGRITGFRPQPAKENQWLYDAEDQAFKGRFLDGEKVFKFVVAREGDEWTLAFKPESGVEDFGEEDLVEDGRLHEFGWLVKRVLKCEFEGVAIAIGMEYLPGDVRFPGKRHSKKLKSAYGHIQGFKGGDKEALDCYVSTELLDLEAEEPDFGTVRSPLLINAIYVVHQIKPDTGEADEEKLMIGWDDMESAKRAYLAEMPSIFFGSIEEMSGKDLEGYRKPTPEPTGDEDADEFAEALLDSEWDAIATLPTGDDLTAVINDAMEAIDGSTND